ncbi:MAG: PAS domain-containing protein [Thainema sp.]
MKTYAENAFAQYPQRLIEALRQLQIHESSKILGRVYVYDLIDQRTIYSSCSVAAILGYTAKAIHVMGPERLARLIHPEELEAVSEYYQRFASLKYGEVVAINYRMKQADGSWYWLYSQETPLVTASDGLPIQILGVTQLLPQLPLAELENLFSGAGCPDDLN